MAMHIDDENVMAFIHENALGNVYLYCLQNYLVVNGSVFVTKRMIDLPVDLIKLLATLCLDRLTGAWGFNLLLP